MVPLVLAVSLAAAQPATPTQPQASPAPVVSAPATPAISTILGGISLGEDSQRAVQSLGSRLGSASKGQLEVRNIPTGYSDLTITVLFDDTIHAIIVGGTSDPKSKYADPFGVRIGDSVERLEQVRGHPDIVNKNGEELQYGPTKGVNWSYEVKGDTIVQIALGDGT
jgi:hypothetical protein